MTPLPESTHPPGSCQICGGTLDNLGPYGDSFIEYRCQVCGVHHFGIDVAYLGCKAPDCDGSCCDGGD